MATSGSFAVAKDSGQALVAGFISAFNFRDLDAMLASLHPEVEFQPLRVFGVDHSYTGHAGVREWFAQLDALEHQHRIVVSALESSPSGGVLVSGRLEIGNYRTPTPFCGVYRLRDWLIIDAQHYMSDLVTLARLGVLP